MWKRGELRGYQLSTGTIIIDNKGKNNVVVIYTRMSSSENKSNLDSQASGLILYCEAKDYVGERTQPNVSLNV